MKKSVVYVTLFVFPVLLQAQELNNFNSGWLTGADVGVNIIVAENFKFPASALNGTGGTYRLFAEYRFTPVFSVRPIAGFASSRWYNKKNGNAFNSEYGAVDLKFDVMNLFSNYYQSRPTSFFLFTGYGMLYRNKINEGKYSDLPPALMSFLRTGGGFEFRIKKSVLMSLNGELNFTGDILNGYEAGKRSFDIIPCITLGLKYDFTPKMRGHWDY